MDLKQIELLTQIASFGSFSRAAAVTGLTQPALGRQIRKLERDCGVRLLYRHGRGVSLTPEGRKFLEQSGPLVRQLVSICSELQTERDHPRGTVTVGLTPTVCSLLGLELIRRVHDAFPLIQINVVTGYSGHVNEWLVDGRLDMAILHDARRSPMVAVEPLASAALYLIRKKTAEPGTDSGGIALSELAELPLALPTRNHGLRRTLEYALRSDGAELDVRFEVDTLELLKQIVAAGLAATVLAYPAVREELAHRRLSARRIVSPTVETRLMLATAAGRPITRAIQVVEDTLKSIISTVIDDSSDAYGLSAPI